MTDSDSGRPLPGTRKDTPIPGHTPQEPTPPPLSPEVKAIVAAIDRLTDAVNRLQRPS